MIIICPSCGKRYKVADDSLGKGRKVRCANCSHRWFAAPPPEDDVEIPDSTDGIDDPGLSARAAAPHQVAHETNDTDDVTADQDARSKRDEFADPQADAEDEGRKARGRRESFSSSPLAAGMDAAHDDEQSANKKAFDRSAAKKKVNSKTASGVGLFGWLLVAIVLIGLAGLVIGRNEVVAMFPKTADYYRMVGMPVTVDIGLEIREMVSMRDNSGSQPTIVISGEIHNVTTDERDVPAIRVALLDDSRQEIEFGLFDPPQSKLTAGGMVKFEARLIDPPEAARNYSVTFDSSTNS